MTRGRQHGALPSTAHLRAGAERDLSILPANPPFPRSDLAQAVIDVLAVLFFFLLAVTFGFAVTAAIFVLLFVGI